MKKRLYRIEITGESAGHTDRMLTRDEANLIQDIFNEVNSEYCSGYIIRMPDEDDMRKIAKNYHEFQKETCYISFYSYYHDFTDWNWRFYEMVENKLKNEMKLI